MYLAVDEFSKFVFNLGTDSALDDQTTLMYIQKLLDDKDFKRFSTSYTLVLPAGEHLKRQILELIAPKGKVVFDENLAFKKIQPFLKSMGLWNLPK